MAAELQRKHALEGAPDPFPSITDSPPVHKASRIANGTGQLDTESQSAFPSLGPSAVPKQPVNTSPWSTASPRIKATVSRTPVISDTFTLSAIDLTSVGKPPATLGDVMKSVMAKFKVKIEASTQRKTGQTTFFIKGESEREVEKARRSLTASLSPVITVTVEAPVSTIPVIIGSKGANIKQIRDQTSTRIEIPRPDTLSPLNGNTNGNSHPSTRAATPFADEEDEPTVTISISGPASLAHEARSMVNAIVASKRSKTSQRVRDIPAHLLPFLVNHQEEIKAVAGDADLSFYFNLHDREAIASGDRDAVVKVIEKTKATILELGTELNSVKISLPKRQHHLLTGSGAEHILEKTRCVVVVSKDTSDEIAVWGKSTDLGAALGAIMERAHSQYTASFDIPAPSSQIFTYLNRMSFGKTLTTHHPNVRIHAPQSVTESPDRISIDFAGDKPAVDAAVKELSTLVHKLKGATQEIDIDWVVQRVLTGKYAKIVKQFHESQHVQVFFSPESGESSKVLLAYDPSVGSAPAERKKNIEAVTVELVKLVKDVGEVKTETLAIEKKWHEAIYGRGNSTLDGIIGEDKTLSIKIGAEADADSTDVIIVRGPIADVDIATAEIHRIVEQAKIDEIESGYTVEFEINRDYVGRIVGSQGSGINRLRDQLDVKVDFSEEEKDTPKKGKTVTAKTKVKITGKKVNADEAKKRILTQVDRLADETSEILRIPRQFHSSLIGPAGKYVIKLEDRHSVKITFPRESDEHGEGKTREALKPDEVLIKGGKKGVATAKAELLDALEFEKEANNVLEFTVPTRVVARILGKGGAIINDIKDRTDASKIDIEKDESSPISHITIRGTKKAITAAKAAILEISDSVEDEVTVTVHVESKFHRTLIGVGGQGLKELIAKCGGPSDSRSQAGLVHFPRQGEVADEVRLRGEPKLVKKLQAELEQVVATMRDRIVLLVPVPAAQHRVLIGRGGQHLTELQNRTGAQIQFPGSRSYTQVGEAENADEFKDADPATLVKVIGPRAACENAIKSLQIVKASTTSPSFEIFSTKISVPLKYFNIISQQGAFFRQLRSLNVHVEHSSTPQKPTSVRPSEPARIDDESDPSQIQWQVVANYQDAEEGTSEWTLKARDQAGLDEAQRLVATAMDHAANATHAGYLTLPDRTAFPRIVGSKGSTVSRLRAETGADITVGRDNNTIVIIGTEAAVEAAKDAINQIAAPRPQRGRDHDD